MLKHVIDVIELLDRPETSGDLLAGHLRSVLAAVPAGAGASGPRPGVEVRTVAGDKGSTDFVSVTIPGKSGRRSGGEAPTLGILGRLGGVGARPERIGLVSDADGAVAALSAAAKLLDMHARGDVLDGDVILSTHVCGWAPTIRQGWVLRVSEDLLSVLETVTGEPARVIPVTTQDITPYGNGVHHINSLLQPAVATDAPVVGLAITSGTAVAGCATGASHETDIAAAARFALETAKAFGGGGARFFDAAEFDRLVELYGPMARLQGRAA